MRGLEAVVARMTLTELARLANTSVEQIVDAAMQHGAQVEVRPQTTTTAPRAGLPVYAVLKLLSRSANAIPLRTLCEALGREPVEILAALQTLELAGQVRSTGRGRAKRFEAAARAHAHDAASEPRLIRRGTRG